MASDISNFQDRRSHEMYILALRRMTPDQRLARAFELSDNVRELFRQGLREAYPHLNDADFHKLYLERLDKCHNRNY